MKLTKKFEDLGKEDAHIAGGKGASLGQMTQTGMPVPPGFVVLADTFERFIKETDINIEIDNILHQVKLEAMHTVENASEQIQALIKSAKMPEDIGAEVLKQFDDLGVEYVAVRSSATAEDSASAAWAGQLDSFLNTTRSDVLNRVQDCWASLFTPRAIFYRFEKDLHKTKISVAVVVQKMVNSEKSGIAFSVHPVTENRNQLIIEAGLGLGEAIVSGQITPDSYVVEKNPRLIIDINISEQAQGLFRAKGGGNKWKDLGDIGKKQVLDQKEILELSALILKIEDHYGFPCDIEWAFEDGAFFIVQSRPITTLAVETLREGGEVKVLDGSRKSNLQINPHHYFYLETVPSGYPMDVAYINLAHVSAPKTRYGFNAGSMCLVFENGGYSIFIEKDKWFDAAKKILDQVLSSDDKVKEWEDRFNSWIKEIKLTSELYRHFDFGALDNKTLYGELEKILAFENKNGLEDVELVTTNYGTNLIYQELERLLKTINVDVNQTTQVIFRATGSFPLFEYEKEIGKLALDYHKQGRSNISLVNLNTDEDLNKKIKDLLTKYGWLDASLTNPPKSIDSVLNDINDLLSFGSELEDILIKRNKEDLDKKTEKERVVKKLLSGLNESQKRTVNFAVTSAELGRLLVDSIMEFIYYRRQIYPEIGRRLGVTENEVKLMTFEEIRQCLVDNIKPDIDLIGTRSKLTVAFVRDNQLSLFSGDEAREVSHELRSMVLEDNSSLKGEVAFSGGKVQGIARIVKDVKDMFKVENDNILVSSRTYPDLLPAMKRSTAIVAELGGLLSHAAIVSRELKIPCVVGVKNAIAQINDGDLIEVDSEKGVIKIIESFSTRS